MTYESSEIEKNVAMTVNVIQQNGQTIALVDTAINNAQDAIELIADVGYHHQCSRFLIDKSCLPEDFFKLSTGLAGEMLQKFISFRAKAAIVGDFSGYTSKPLRDFIYECNSGNDIFFTATRDEAVERLSNARWL